MFHKKTWRLYLKSIISSNYWRHSNLDSPPLPAAFHSLIHSFPPHPGWLDVPNHSQGNGTSQLLSHRNIPGISSLTLGAKARREGKLGNASTPGKTFGILNFRVITSLFLRGLLPFGCDHPELWDIRDGGIRLEAALDKLLDICWENPSLLEQIPALELTHPPGAFCQENLSLQNLPVSFSQGCYPQVKQAPLGAAWKSFIQRLRKSL